MLVYRFNDSKNPLKIVQDLYNLALKKNIDWMA